MGVKEPQATFSPCFGGPFLVWHPGKYSQLLSARLRKHGSQVWLVSTGWTGGGYGEGKRIPLQHTRSIIAAIYSGALADAPTQTGPVFGLEVITQCPNVPMELLWPRDTWKDAAAFDRTATKLATLFGANFAKYAPGLRPEVIAAGPKA
jgi:phosphoenolpyruvate carboxykinase (ATP)